LPPKIGFLHHHDATVISVSWICIGTTGAPEGICQIFSTVTPNPVFLLALQRLKVICNKN
jgi:hypothetical protein